jgi:hypothetical protein
MCPVLDMFGRFGIDQVPECPFSETADIIFEAGLRAGVLGKRKSGSDQK